MAGFKIENIMMWTTKTTNEVYVWRNGKLIFKKWLNQNNWVLMNNPRDWKNQLRLIIK